MATPDGRPDTATPDAHETGLATGPGRYETGPGQDPYGAGPALDPYGTGPERDARGTGPERGAKSRGLSAVPGASFGGEAPDGPGPLERLRNLVSGDELDPGRPGLRILLVVGVIAVLAGGWYWWHARPREQPLPAPSPVRPVAADPRPPGTPGAPPVPSGGPSSGASPAATSVVVDVAGKVRHPGVVHLPAGSRVIDAIDKAGGVKPGAPTTSLNLARVLVDGEQIVVGASAAPTAGAVPQPGVPSGASPGASPGTTVSLNTATPEQLEDLPGIGPALAKRITDYRTQHGGFRSVDELQDVSGIGPKRYADLKAQVTL